MINDWVFVYCENKSVVFVVIDILWTPAKVLLNVEILNVVLFEMNQSGFALWPSTKIV